MNGKKLFLTAHPFPRFTNDTGDAHIESALI